MGCTSRPVCGHSLSPSAGLMLRSAQLHTAFNEQATGDGAMARHRRDGRPAVAERAALIGEDTHSSVRRVQQ